MDVVLLSMLLVLAVWTPLHCRPIRRVGTDFDPGTSLLDSSDRANRHHAEEVAPQTGPGDDMQLPGPNGPLLVQDSAPEWDRVNLWKTRKKRLKNRASYFRNHLKGESSSPVKSFELGLAKMKVVSRKLQTTLAMAASRLEKDRYRTPDSRMNDQFLRESATVEESYATRPLIGNGTFNLSAYIPRKRDLDLPITYSPLQEEFPGFAKERTGEVILLQRNTETTQGLESSDDHFSPQTRNAPTGEGQTSTVLMGILEEIAKATTDITEKTTVRHRRHTHVNVKKASGKPVSVSATRKTESTTRVVGDSATTLGVTPPEIFAKSVSGKTTTDQQAPIEYQSIDIDARSWPSTLQNIVAAIVRSSNAPRVKSATGTSNAPSPTAPGVGKQRTSVLYKPVYVAQSKGLSVESFTTSDFSERVTTPQSDASAASTNVTAVNRQPAIIITDRKPTVSTTISQIQPLVGTTQIGVSNKSFQSMKTHTNGLPIPGPYSTLPVSLPLLKSISLSPGGTLHLLKSKEDVRHSSAASRALYVTENSTLRASTLPAYLALRKFSKDRTLFQGTSPPLQVFSIVRDTSQPAMGQGVSLSTPLPTAAGFTTSDNKPASTNNFSSSVGINWVDNENDFPFELGYLSSPLWQFAFTEPSPTLINPAWTYVPTYLPQFSIDENGQLVAVEPSNIGQSHRGNAEALKSPEGQDDVSTHGESLEKKSTGSFDNVPMTTENGNATACKAHDSSTTVANGSGTKGKPSQAVRKMMLLKGCPGVTYCLFTLPQCKRDELLTVSIKLQDNETSHSTAGKSVTLPTCHCMTNETAAMTEKWVTLPICNGTATKGTTARHQTSSQTANGTTHSCACTLPPFQHVNSEATCTHAQGDTQMLVVELIHPTSPCTRKENTSSAQTFNMCSTACRDVFHGNTNVVNSTTCISHIVTTRQTTKEAENSSHIPTSSHPPEVFKNAFSTNGMMTTRLGNNFTSNVPDNKIQTSKLVQYQFVDNISMRSKPGEGASPEGKSVIHCICAIPQKGGTGRVQNVDTCNNTVRLGEVCLIESTPTVPQHVFKEHSKATMQKTNESVQPLPEMGVGSVTQKALVNEQQAYNDVNVTMTVTTPKLEECSQRATTSRSLSTTGICIWVPDVSEQHSLLESADQMHGLHEQMQSNISSKKSNTAMDEEATITTHPVNTPSCSCNQLLTATSNSKSNYSFGAMSNGKTLDDKRVTVETANEYISKEQMQVNCYFPDVSDNEREKRSETTVSSGNVQGSEYGAGEVDSAVTGGDLLPDWTDMFTEFEIQSSEANPTQRPAVESVRGLAQDATARKTIYTLLGQAGTRDNHPPSRHRKYDLGSVLTSKLGKAKNEMEVPVETAQLKASEILPENITIKFPLFWSLSKSGSKTQPHNVFQESPRKFRKEEQHFDVKMSESPNILRGKLMLRKFIHNSEASNDEQLIFNTPCTSHSNSLYSFTKVKNDRATIARGHTLPEIIYFTTSTPNRGLLDVYTLSGGTGQTATPRRRHNLIPPTEKSNQKNVSQSSMSSTLQVTSEATHQFSDILEVPFTLTNKQPLSDFSHDLQRRDAPTREKRGEWGNLDDIGGEEEPQIEKEKEYKKGKIKRKNKVNEKRKQKEKSITTSDKKEKKLVTTSKVNTHKIEGETRNVTRKSSELKSENEHENITEKENENKNKTETVAEETNELEVEPGKEQNNENSRTKFHKKSKIETYLKPNVHGKSVSFHKSKTNLGVKHNPDTIIYSPLHSINPTRYKSWGPHEEGAVEYWPRGRAYSKTKPISGRKHGIAVDEQDDGASADSSYSRIHHHSGRYKVPFREAGPRYPNHSPYVSPSSTGSQPFLSKTPVSTAVRTTLIGTTTLPAPTAEMTRSTQQVTHSSIRLSRYTTQKANRETNPGGQVKEPAKQESPEGELDDGDESIDEDKNTESPETVSRVWKRRRKMTTVFSHWPQPQVAFLPYAQQTRQSGKSPYSPSGLDLSPMTQKRMNHEVNESAQLTFITQQQKQRHIPSMAYRSPLLVLDPNEVTHAWRYPVASLPQQEEMPQSVLYDRQVHDVREETGEGRPAQTLQTIIPHSQHVVPLEKTVHIPIQKEYLTGSHELVVTLQQANRHSKDSQISTDTPLANDKQTDEEAEYYLALTVQPKLSPPKSHAQTDIVNLPPTEMLDQVPVLKQQSILPTCLSPGKNYSSDIYRKEDASNVGARKYPNSQSNVGYNAYRPPVLPTALPLNPNETFAQSGSPEMTQNNKKITPLPKQDSLIRLIMRTNSLQEALDNEDEPSSFTSALQKGGEGPELSARSTLSGYFSPIIMGTSGPQVFTEAPRVSNQGSMDVRSHITAVGLRKQFKRKENAYVHGVPEYRSHTRALQTVGFSERLGNTFQTTDVENSDSSSEISIGTVDHTDGDNFSKVQTAVYDTAVKSTDEGPLRKMIYGSENSQGSEDHPPEETYAYDDNDPNGEKNNLNSPNQSSGNVKRKSKRMENGMKLHTIGESVKEVATVFFNKTLEDSQSKATSPGVSKVEQREMSSESETPVHRAGVSETLPGPTQSIQRRQARFVLPTILNRDIKTNPPVSVHNGVCAQAMQHFSLFVPPYISTTANPSSCHQGTTANAVDEILHRYPLVLEDLTFDEMLPTSEVSEPITYIHETQTQVITKCSSKIPQCAYNPPSTTLPPQNEIETNSDEEYTGERMNSPASKLPNDFPDDMNTKEELLRLLKLQHSDSSLPSTVLCTTNELEDELKSNVSETDLPRAEEQIQGKNISSRSVLPMSNVRTTKISLALDRSRRQVNPVEMYLNREVGQDNPVQCAKVDFQNWDSYVPNYTPEEANEFQTASPSVLHLAPCDRKLESMDHPFIVVKSSISPEVVRDIQVPPLLRQMTPAAVNNASTQGSSYVDSSESLYEAAKTLSLPWEERIVSSESPLDVQSLIQLKPLQLQMQGVTEFPSNKDSTPQSRYTLSHQLSTLPNFEIPREYFTPAAEARVSTANSTPNVDNEYGTQNVTKICTDPTRMIMIDWAEMFPVGGTVGGEEFLKNYFVPNTTLLAPKAFNIGRLRSNAKISNSLPKIGFWQDIDNKESASKYDGTITPGLTESTVKTTATAAPGNHTETTVPTTTGLVQKESSSSTKVTVTAASTVSTVTTTKGTSGTTATAASTKSSNNREATNWSGFVVWSHLFNVSDDLTVGTTVISTNGTLKFRKNMNQQFAGDDVVLLDEDDDAKATAVAAANTTAGEGRTSSVGTTRTSAQGGASEGKAQAFFGRTTHVTSQTLQVSGGTVRAREADAEPSGDGRASPRAKTTTTEPESAATPTITDPDGPWSTTHAAGLRRETAVGVPSPPEEFFSTANSIAYLAAVLVGSTGRRAF